MASKHKRTVEAVGTAIKDAVTSVVTVAEERVIEPVGKALGLIEEGPLVIKPTRGRKPTHPKIASRMKSPVFRKVAARIMTRAVGMGASRPKSHRSDVDHYGPEKR